MMRTMNRLDVHRRHRCDDSPVDMPTDLMDSDVFELEIPVDDDEMIPRVVLEFQIVSLLLLFDFQEMKMDVSFYKTNFRGKN